MPLIEKQARYQAKPARANKNLSEQISLTEKAPYKQLPLGSSAHVEPD